MHQVFLLILPLLYVHHAAANMCGDGSYCPSFATCCLTPNGRYACCPRQNAVCCADGEHCCPGGYRCDLAGGRCLRGEVLGSIRSTYLSLSKRVESDDVVCPGKDVKCPSGATCCQTPDGSYGCCPTPNAVCCSDHIHCCPEGRTCDVAEGRCLLEESEETQPLLAKFPAKRLHIKASTHLHKPIRATENKCGDGSSCPSFATCCQALDGSYACCPQTNAVCCDDGEHCCPGGYICDLAGGRCLRAESEEIQPLLAKFPAKRLHIKASTHLHKPIRATENKCGDGSSCPSFATCCQALDGSYACCPQTNAVCCDDGEHCCPGGYICDLAGGRCLRVESKETQPWLAKFPTKRLRSKVGTHLHKPTKATENKCGDGSSCPSFATCCQAPDGSYACCPVPNAVCCEDGEHCCPEGHVCDLAGGRCLRAETEETQPWLAKFPATRLHNKAGARSHSPIRNEMILISNMDKIELIRTFPLSESNDVVCPGYKFKCPSDTTCCKTPDGSYGCCPMPNAVCCPDHEHCCPQGTTCDLSGGHCLLEETLETQPWSTKIPATRLHSKSGTELREPIRDEVMMMLISNTVNIDYDSHVEPEHEVNDEEQINRAVDKYLVSFKEASADIPCGSSTKCTGKSTCCTVKNGEGKIDHMCCPHRDAVCCDGFCCPHGYTCKSNGRRCEKKAHQTPFYLYN